MTKTKITQSGKRWIEAYHSLKEIKKCFTPILAYKIGFNISQIEKTLLSNNIKTLSDYVKSDKNELSKEIIELLTSKFEIEICSLTVNEFENYIISPNFFVNCIEFVFLNETSTDDSQT